MKNKKLILILVIMLVIGFASISTTLVINGVIGVSNKKEDFKVIFTNAKLDGIKRKDFIDDSTKQTIDYETNKLVNINEETTLEYEVTNTSRLYDASVTISCTTPENEYVAIEYVPTSMSILAGESKTGSVTVKLIKSSTEDQSISVTCELNANAIERESLGQEYIPIVSFPEGYELIDSNKNGIEDIGEEIQIGTESFYVISNNATELNALAKYNLKVGNIYTSNGTLERTISSSEEGYGIQNAQMRGLVAGDKRCGTLAFSNNNGWPYANNATINIKQYDGPVKTFLYGASGYEKYIKNIISKASVRLITKSELESLKCSSSNQSCLGAPSWVYNTSYWTQSAYSSSDRKVWRVTSSGVFNPDGFQDSNGRGVRPVITIPLS